MSSTRAVDVIIQLVSAALKVSCATSVGRVIGAGAAGLEAASAGADAAGKGGLDATAGAGVTEAAGAGDAAVPAAGAWLHAGASAP
ncbi:MAG: hypothetical protein ABIR26_09660, partial [Ramlibacter sp.]